MKELIFNANYATKNVIYAILGSLVYLMLSAWLIGFKTDQVFLVILFNFLFFISDTTQRFILGFMIFIVFWIIFDFMKILPNYKVNAIHIDDLYLRELRWFGIDDGGIILTANEYAEKHSALSLDIMSGLFYLNWIPIPLFFASYLFASDKLLFLRFSLTFLLVNLLGFVVYYLYPAAPPWYVKEFGFKVLYDTPGHTGALGRFDAYFGVNVFSGLYSKSSNVFAAMPSLHCAYPVVVLYYSIQKRMGWICVLCFVFMAGIWFSAVYTGHHYIQDVLGGLICAIVGIWLFNFVTRKSNSVRIFILRYRDAISSF